MHYAYKGKVIHDCPFCHNSWGTPKTAQVIPGGRWNVLCMNIHCGASSGFCDTEDEAINLWNTRPTTSTAAERLLQAYDALLTEQSAAVNKVVNLQQEFRRLLGDAPQQGPTADQMLNWLEEQTMEGVVTMCFELDGGIHVTLDPMGGTQRAARNVNSVREGVARLMADRPLATVADAAPRETQGIDSVGDDLACVSCGKVALDTGLECSECGFDNQPAIEADRAEGNATPPEKTVTYRGADDDQVRWGGNDDPRGLLVEGQKYTVKSTEVHSFHTKIELVEFPGKKFNSVCFAIWAVARGEG